MSVTQEVQQYADEIFGKDNYKVVYEPFKGFHATSQHDAGPSHTITLGETGAHAHAILDEFHTRKQERGTLGNVD